MKAPLEMPDEYIGLQTFELERVDFTSPEASGRINGVQAGFPLWTGAWTLGRMPLENSDEWRAFVSQLRGATRRFLGRDFARQFPKEYPDGFDEFMGFDGECSGWSESISADGDSELTLEGLPDGFVLSVGDYIGFKWTATEDSVAGLEWRAVVRVVQGGTSFSYGDLTVLVEPPVPSAVPGSAIAHLDEPACVMSLVTDQTSLDAIDRLYSIRGGQIVGLQDIRA